MSDTLGVGVTVTDIITSEQPGDCLVSTVVEDVVSHELGHSSLEANGACLVGSVVADVVSHHSSLEGIGDEGHGDCLVSSVVEDVSHSHHSSLEGNGNEGHGDYLVSSVVEGVVSHHSSLEGNGNEGHGDCLVCSVMEDVISHHSSLEGNGNEVPDDCLISSVMEDVVCRHTSLEGNSDEGTGDSLISSIMEDISHQLDYSSLEGKSDEGMKPMLETPVVVTPIQIELLQENGTHDHDSTSCVHQEVGVRQDYSEEGDGNHSGNNSSLPEMVLDLNSLIAPPNEELQQKVISLVEFYFSDESILKDAFLLKHVRRNRFGFVSLKLITSFKKMKALTRDYHVVAYCLKASEKLELNVECTKVRRKDPLPDYDETVPSRTVVALNLPLENPTMENMAEIFSKCGCVNNFRILRPGSSIPSDLHKFACKYPELESTMCAVVAFENYDQAQKACEILTNSDDWRKGMRVIPLMVPKKKEDKDKKEKKDMKKKDSKDIFPEEYPVDDKKRRRRGGHRKKTRIDELNHDSSCYSSGSEGDSLSKSSVSSANKYLNEDHFSKSINPPRAIHTSPVGSPQNKQRSHGKSPLIDLHPGFSPRSSPETVRQSLDSSEGDSAPSSPWVQRRLRVAQEKVTLGSPLLGQRNLDCSVTPRLTPRMLDRTNVLRQPKGPDNTKGFYGGLGRGKPRSITIA